MSRSNAAAAEELVILSCLGGNGIIISTAGINVTLRGLTLIGPECTIAPIGIDITAAAVVRIEDCKISGFSRPASRSSRVREALMSKYRIRQSTKMLREFSSHRPAAEAQ